jgi:predicted nucleotidyltransferase
MSLSSILFTDYRRRVLGLLLLHPEKRYHVREIARLTGTVTGTLTRELGKLTEAGLLLRERVGNQVQYTANRDCPVFEELASILRKTSGLVDVLADALLPLLEKIDVAFVYGSVASGKSGTFSDIDLMIVGEVDLGDVVQLLYPAQTTLGREINPQIYTAKEWQALVKKGSAFVRDVLAKPKLFVMGGQDDLG